MKSQEQFKVGVNEISWISSSFEQKLYGIEFEEKSAAGLVTKTLPRYMNDAEISKEFGPEPVELGDILAYLKEADHSKWYIFYVNDASGTLWAVSADWDDRGWGVGAGSVAYPSAWGGGSVVVSRRFSDTQNQVLVPLEILALTKRIEALEDWKRKVQEHE